MKKYHFLAICLMAVLTGFYFLSCSNDDDKNDEPKGSSTIVGTWVSSYMDSYSGYDEEYVMFCADGTLYEFEEDRSHGVDYVEVDKMEYVYNEAKNTLTILENGYAFTIDVLSLTDTKLILAESSGSGYETYEKVKSPYSQAQLEKFYQAQESSYSY